MASVCFEIKKAKSLKKKVAKQKLKNTALKIIYKHKDMIRRAGLDVLFVLINKLSSDFRPYGIDIDMKGGFLNVVVNAMTVQKVLSMSYSELPLVKTILSDNNLLMKEYQQYNQNYTFDEFIKDVVPLLGLIHYVSSMFEPKLVAITQYNNTSGLDKHLLKIVAYFHKIGLIEVSANNRVVGSEMIVQKLKSGISGYSTKKSVKHQSANNIAKDRDDSNIFDNLINNAYRVKYVSGKNGKHAFHKSPEPHWRKEHWKTTRNGFRVHIRGTWVNGNPDST